jgi:hypothetical protein
MPSRKPARDSRQSPRLHLPPMYTVIRVRPQGAQKFVWTGHIYDISAEGMRFELDEPLPEGAAVEVRAMLPGTVATTVCGAGHIVRRHDDDADPGPVRMGFAFDHLAPSHRRRLEGFIAARVQKAA